MTRRAARRGTARWRRAAGIVALLAAGAGCRTAGRRAQPDLSSCLPASGRIEADAAGTNGPAARLTGRWWEEFEDPRLTGLIESALGGNFDLVRMRERIVGARALRKLAGAERIPRVDLVGEYAYAETGTDAVAFQAPPPGTEADVYAAGAMASWEIDLWGRVARRVESAAAGVEASVEEWRHAAVSLAAETALTYVEIRSLQERAALVENRIRVFEDLLGLAGERHAAGSGTRLELAETRRALHRARSLRPETARLLAAALNRAAILAGKRPGDFSLAAGTMPALPRLPPVGVPARLVLRRADVRAAERRYAASRALAAAAAADRYPRLSLSGSFVLSAAEPADLSVPEARVLAVGPRLTFPLYSGGRISGEIRARQSEADQALLRLREVVLNATVEAEDAASGVARAYERVHALEEAETEARRSVELAGELYRNGVRGRRDGLENELELLDVRDGLLTARQSALSQVIRLCRALGGGWSDPEAGISEETGGHGGRENGSAAATTPSAEVAEP